MSIPGYTEFDMAARLFADLFPRAKDVDGDDKRMVRIGQALQEACEYGEKFGSCPVCNPEQPEDK